MAQLPCIGLYKPCINPPFGDCAMYFDHGVLPIDPNFQRDIQGIKIPQSFTSEQLKPNISPETPTSSGPPERVPEWHLAVFF